MHIGSLRLTSGRSDIRGEKLWFVLNVLFAYVALYFCSVHKHRSFAMPVEK